jgi:hypothetical protein
MQLGETCICKDRCSKWRVKSSTIEGEIDWVEVFHGGSKDCCNRTKVKGDCVTKVYF